MINNNVVILGASRKPDRYANRAQQKLLAHGYEVFPVAREAGEILGITAYVDLEEINASIDTVTVYVRPEILMPILDKILALRPRRVIFNPGTESDELADKLRSAGIVVIEACTLVLLSTDQFELDES